MGGRFEVVCEIEPPTSADMGIVREQIAVLRRSCDAFLVPDSHLGRATVSSVAVAHEVAYLHGRAVACLNARDRNLLGFRRDLLTAAAYGVEELLFVYGDAPRHGERSGLTVRQMLEEMRSTHDGERFRVGVTVDVTRDLPGWKRGAHFAFAQISFDEGAVVRWRDRTGFEGQVYAGVVVLASDKMAIRLCELIPGFEVPDALMADLARDASVGVDRAMEQVLRLRDSGAVDGVHLIPARQFRQTADALERAGI
ncbi:MAG TPA: methylenetetrahydrofolate reductase [Nitriliruptorales bacterium]|nr:methylenetetrahydrofolate reductase [Nitriliruptorales bacterium]